MLNWYEYSPNYDFLSTKSDDSKEFDLVTPEGRRKYFDAKVSKEIEFLREFLKEHTFVAYLLAPKNAGKGTMIKGLGEALGGSHFIHVSVGDVVRNAEEEYREKGKDSEVYKYAQKNFRGYMHLDEVFIALTNRTTASLVPTEFILTLIKRVLDSQEKKTVFVDGFPRNMDQISYALYFRELINYRDDPDLFVMLNAPATLLDERIKFRVICPECKTPRSTKLHATAKIGFDTEMNEYFLVCDNPQCKHPSRMVPKEGDELGVEPIKDRILMDVQLMERARKLYGVPKVEIYNSIEVDKAFDYVEEYELTGEYYYEHEGGKIITKIKPWTFEDNDKKYYSLLPSLQVVQFIRQLYKVFHVEE